MNQRSLHDKSGISPCALRANRRARHEIVSQVHPLGTEYGDLRDSNMKAATETPIKTTATTAATARRVRADFVPGLERLTIRVTAPITRTVSRLELPI